MFFFSSRSTAAAIVFVSFEGCVEGCLVVWLEGGVDVDVDDVDDDNDDGNKTGGESKKKGAILKNM